MFDAICPDLHPTSTGRIHRVKINHAQLTSLDDSLGFD